MFDYASISEYGNRKINEDYLGYSAKNGNYCFIVCDGLGGHGMGDVASKLVSDVFIEHFNNCNEYDSFLSSAFCLAQNKLTEHQLKCNAKNKMRTTAAAVIVNNNFVHLGHVGDSRIYVFGKNGLRMRTIDHSVPQILALSGQIQESEIRCHPDRNIVLRAMGTEWEKPMQELSEPIPLTECTALLLCSDGFWEYINESQMQTALNESATSTEWLDKMKSIVMTNGKNVKMDNFTAIAVII